MKGDKNMEYKNENIEFPNQIIEDADAPLLVKLNLLNSAGETEVAIYSIR